MLVPEVLRGATDDDPDELRCFAPRASTAAGCCAASRPACPSRRPA
ncbi:hypothetical protein ACFQ0M_34640 [Kitasatospora aburaviensis]